MTFIRHSVFLAALLLLSLPSRAETDAKAQQALDDIRRGKDNQNQIQVLRVRDSVSLPAGAIGADDIASGAITGAKLGSSAVVQRDTNTTTTTTSYTAAAIGQLLIGRTGSTGTLWYATATGTNSWTKVLPLP